MIFDPIRANGSLYKELGHRWINLDLFFARKFGPKKKLQKFHKNFKNVMIFDPIRANGSLYKELRHGWDQLVDLFFARKFGPKKKCKNCFQNFRPKKICKYFMNFFHIRANGSLYKELCHGWDHFRSNFSHRTCTGLAQAPELAPGSQYRLARAPKRARVTRARSQARSGARHGDLFTAP